MVPEIIELRDVAVEAHFYSLQCERAVNARHQASGDFFEEVFRHIIELLRAARIAIEQEAAVAGMLVYHCP